MLTTTVYVNNSLLYVTIHLIQYPLYMLTAVHFYITSPLYYNPLHTSISIYIIYLFILILYFIYISNHSLSISYIILVLSLYIISLSIYHFFHSFSLYNFSMKINMNISLMKMSIKCIKYVYLCTNVYILIINELHYFFYI